MIKQLVFILFSLLVITSCDSEDGDWESMKWNSTNYEQIKVNKSEAYAVPAQGGVYTFKCKNYSGFWVCSIAETIDGITSYLENQDNSQAHYLTDFCETECDGYTLTVTIYPNGSTLPHFINVEVEAGDAFSDVSFYQEAAQTEQ